MREKGLVAEIKGHKARVLLLYNPEICKECSAKLFCGINPRETEGFVWARFSRPPRAGQVVEIEIPEAKAILLSTVMFIVPIIIYSLAFWLVHLFIRSIGISALIALVPVVAYYSLLVRFSDFFTPRVVE